MKGEKVCAYCGDTITDAITMRVNKNAVTYFCRASRGTVGKDCLNSFLMERVRTKLHRGDYGKGGYSNAK